jgi:hypothetical protein
VLEKSLIRIFEPVGPPWSLMTAFRLLPVFLRVWLYERIARNRLSLFGTRATCYAPSRADRERFFGVNRRNALRRSTLSRVPCDCTSPSPRSAPL